MSTLTKYVWAVYPMVPVRDEASATQKTLSINANAKTMASTSYSVSSTLFTLTNATSTTFGGLTGKYFVYPNSQSQTATTGAKLYEAISVSGGNPCTITMMEYLITFAKGETMLYMVESDTLEYPINDEQDGLWYELRESTHPYVWDVYPLGYIRDEASATQKTLSINANAKTMASTSYSVSSTLFTLTNATQTTFGNLKGKYFVYPNSQSLTATTGAKLYEAISVSSGNPCTITMMEYLITFGKMDTLSHRIGANTMDYPVNGEHDDGMWYVLRKSELPKPEISATNKSLGMNFAKRRLMLFQKELKFIWAMYSSSGEFLKYVQSDTEDYPRDGTQGGYRYVMVKGVYTNYVWDQYTKATGSQYTAGTGSSESYSVRLTNTISYGGPAMTTTSYVRSYPGASVNASTGAISTTGGYTDSQSGLVGRYSYIKGGQTSTSTGSYTYNNVIGTSANGTSLYKIISETTQVYMLNLVIAPVTAVSTTVYVKGTLTGQEFASPDINAYPADGASGDYWYVRNSSKDYEVPFDSRKN